MSEKEKKPIKNIINEGNYNPPPKNEIRPLKPTPPPPPPPKKK